MKNLLKDLNIEKIQANGIKSLYLKRTLGFFKIQTNPINSEKDIFNKFELSPSLEANECLKLKTPKSGMIAPLLFINILRQHS